MTDPESAADKQDADEYESSVPVVPVPTPPTDPESAADKQDADEYDATQH